MNEAKHTQGEWSVLEHDGEVFILADGAMQIAAVTYVIEHASEQGSRRLQNARMMAAAPVLLEALADIAMKAELAANACDDDGRAAGFRILAERARAAIAAATGSTS